MIIYMISVLVLYNCVIHVLYFHFTCKTDKMNYHPLDQCVTFQGYIGVKCNTK